MKKRITLTRVFLVVSLLVCSILVMALSPKELLAAEPVTIKVYNPTGAIQVNYLFSPRLADLNGKTICDLSDNMWEVTRTFPLIDQLLQKQFPTAKIIPYTEFPDGTADNDKSANLMKQKGCQAVIVGNAG